jgi:hypothetical protein
MIVIEHDRSGGLIVLRASGELTTQDYETAIPALEHALEQSGGPLRVLMRLEDFRGWEIGALLRDLESNLRHRGDFGRIAVIGETRLEAWGSTLSAPFSKAEMAFFTVDQQAEALAWLRDAPPEDPGAPDGSA